MTEHELLQKGIGRKISFLGRAADMISVSLSPSEDHGSEFAIHIMTDCEILFHGKQLTNSKELYQNTHSDRTVYDEKVNQLMCLGKEFVLQRLSYDVQGCLRAEFRDGLVIMTIPEEPAPRDDVELWRVFLVHANAPHLIATGNGVHFDEED